VVTINPPAGGWPEFATVSVEGNLGVRDVFGRPISAVFRSVFQTADVTPPAVLSANLVQKQLAVQGSEAIVPGSGTVLLTDTTSGAVAGTYSYSNGNRTVIFKPNAPLADDHSFTLVVDGWTDVYGNPQAAPYAPSTPFSTSDHDAPS